MRPRFFNSVLAIMVFHIASPIASSVFLRLVLFLVLVLVFLVGHVANVRRAVLLHHCCRCCAGYPTRVGAP